MSSYVMDETDFHHLSMMLSLAAQTAKAAPPSSESGQVFTRLIQDPTAPIFALSTPTVLPTPNTQLRFYAPAGLILLASAPLLPPINSEAVSSQAACVGWKVDPNAPGHVYMWVIEVCGKALSSTATNYPDNLDDPTLSHTYITRTQFAYAVVNYLSTQVMDQVTPATTNPTHTQLARRIYSNLAPHKAA